ncbi:hypothetical protein J1614_000087 [Plenodomus biglobosus]|nr:hypothetical protein J1614_000087 [Plenodomus biglobosus]
MVGVTLMPLVALSIFLAQVAAQSGCSVSVLNVNGAEKGSACIEPGQPGDIPVDNPPHGRIDISVSATAQCGLGNPTHNLPPDWTLRSNGRCELPRPDLPRPNPPRPNPPHPSPSPHKGGSGGGGGGVPIIPPPPPPGKVVPPPGGGGSGSQPKPKPKKRCSREYCHGPQGVSECFGNHCSSQSNLFPVLYSAWYQRFM